MNKNDLKNGMSFIMKSNEKCYILSNNIYLETDKNTLKFCDTFNLFFEDYLEDLTDMYNHSFDIMKVFDINNNLIWKRDEIDWSKVPVDTKIWVRDFEDNNWLPRHFAKYENGKVFAYDYGRTSWSCENKPMLDWNYAKLAEDPEKEKSHITWDYIIKKIDEDCPIMSCDDISNCVECQFSRLSKNFDEIIKEYYSES